MSLKRSIEFFECSFLVEREPGSIVCFNLCFHVSDETLSFFSLQVLCKLSRPKELVTPIDIGHFP